MKKKYIVGISAVVVLLITVFIFFSGEEQTQVSDAIIKESEVIEKQETISEISTGNPSIELTDPTESSQKSSARKTNQPLEHELDADEFIGYVRDATEDALRPMDGVEVQALFFPHNVYSNVEKQPMVLAETVTDSDGSFVFEYLDFNGQGTLGYRAEYPGFSSLIKLFPNGDGVDNLALTTFMMLKADSIKGIVVDQYGEPVPNAHVGEIVLEDSVGGQLTATAGTYVSSWDKTNSQGEFVLSGIPLPDRDPERPRAKREFQLPATAFGYSKGLSEPVQAGYDDVEIQVYKSEGSLFGTVSNHVRKKAPGAKVSLIPQMDIEQTNRPGKVETVTDGDGSFAFPDLTAGRYVLMVEKKIDSALGFNPSVYKNIDIAIGSKRSEYVILPAPVEVSGYILSVEGDPISDFIFYTNIEEMTARLRAPKIVSDDAGYFEFEIYVPRMDSTVGFSPRMPVSIPSPWRPAETDSQVYRLDDRDIILHGLEPGDQLEDVQIVLEEGAAIEGVVYEPDAETPATNTSVFYRGSSTFGTVLTNEKGEFSILALEDEKLTIEASTEQGIAAKEVTAPDSEVMLELEEYASISGYVYDPDGNGVSGRDVRIERVEKNGGIKSAVRFEEFSITNEEGFYEIINVAPDDLEVNLRIASRTEYVQPKPISLRPSPGEVIENVNFQLEVGDYIEGYVLNENGEGLDEVSLLTPDSRLSAETDEAGYFKIIGIPLDEPIAFITATKRGFEEETKKNVTIYDGMLEFELRKLKEVEVIAQTASGSPVPDYKLRLQQSVQTPAGFEMETVREKVVNNESARTTLVELNEGNYRVEVIKLNIDGLESQERGAEEFTISTDGFSEETVTVRLSDGLFIRGTVVDNQSGQPVPQASVLLGNLPTQIQLEGATFEGPPYDRKARFSTDENAAFQIGPLSPGEYKLMAEADDSVSVWVEVSLGTEQKNVTLELVQAPVITGQLYDKNEELIERATLFFAQGNGPPSGPPISVRDGVFSHKLNAPGEWRIIASIDGTTENQTKIVQVNSGEKKEVVFNFADEVELTGALHINGLPAENSNLVLRGNDGNEAYVRLERTGLYTAKLTPGQYQPYIVTNEMTAPVGTTITVPEGSDTHEQDLAIQLARLDLLIDSSDAFEVGYLDLFQENSGGTTPVTTNYRIDRSGIRFIDVPVGNYQAIVTLNDETTLSSGWTSIQAGQENSLVVLPNGS